MGEEWAFQIAPHLWRQGWGWLVELLADRVVCRQDRDLLHPVRVLLGDMYLAFRVLFVATLTPVSAMLIGNAKGVQVSIKNVMEIDKETVGFTGVVSFKDTDWTQISLAP